MEKEYIDERDVEHFNNGRLLKTKEILRIWEMTEEDRESRDEVEVGLPIVEKTYHVEKGRILDMLARDLLGDVLITEVYLKQSPSLDYLADNREVIIKHFSWLSFYPNFKISPLSLFKNILITLFDKQASIQEPVRQSELRDLLLAFHRPRYSEKKAETIVRESKKAIRLAEYGALDEKGKELKRLMTKHLAVEEW